MLRDMQTAPGIQRLYRGYQCYEETFNTVFLKATTTTTAAPSTVTTTTTTATLSLEVVTVVSLHNERDANPVR